MEARTSVRLFGWTSWTALAAYTILTALLTWPLVLRMGTGVPSDLGDPLLNAWLLWWNAVTVPFTEAWWNPPAFYPAQSVLTFSEHLLGLTPISSPVYWTTGNVQLAYNVVFFASFALTAYFTYLLCLELTGRHEAAFIGGLIFGFAPYRIAQLPHLQVLCAYGMPLALLGLHRYLRDARPRWLILFGGGWLLQSLSNGYFMAYLSVLVCGWCVWFVAGRDWRRLCGVTLTLALAALSLVPILWRYRQVHSVNGLSRDVREMLMYSADLTAVFVASDSLTLWGWLPGFRRAEGELFPGLASAIVLIVAAIGLRVVAARGTTPSETMRMPRSLARVRVALWVAVLIFVGAAVSGFVSPWVVDFAGMRLSVTRASKPLSIGLCCALVLGLSSPRMRRLIRERSVGAFYGSMAVLCWSLSWGPRPTLLGRELLEHGPYRLLTWVPGFDTFRTPARMHMVTMLCLSCAAAVAFATFAQRVSLRTVRLLTAAIVVVGVGDTWLGTFPLADPPSLVRAYGRASSAPLLHVPLGDPGLDVGEMYRSTGTSVRLVNGYSGFSPAWYPSLARGLRQQDPRALEVLRQWGVRQLLLDIAAPEAVGWTDFLARQPGIRAVSEDGGRRLYALAEARGAQGLPPRETVRVAKVVANVHSDDIRFVSDDDLKTRWDSGRPMEGNEVLVLDLGSPTLVDALELALGSSVSDGPSLLAIEVSDDEAQWTEVWRGTTVAEAMAAARLAPDRIPVTLAIGVRSTRFIRLRQLLQDPRMFWAIAELRVLRPAAQPTP